jgi:hypothetical protein
LILEIEEFVNRGFTGSLAAIKEVVGQCRKITAAAARPDLPFAQIKIEKNMPSVRHSPTGHSFLPTYKSTPNCLEGVMAAGVFLCALIHRVRRSIERQPPSSMLK